MAVLLRSCDEVIWKAFPLTSQIPGRREIVYFWANFHAIFIKMGSQCSLWLMWLVCFVLWDAAVVYWLNERGRFGCVLWKQPVLDLLGASPEMRWQISVNSCSSTDQAPCVGLKWAVPSAPLLPDFQLFFLFVFFVCFFWCFDLNSGWKFKKRWNCPVFYIFKCHIQDWLLIGSTTQCFSSLEKKLKTKGTKRLELVALKGVPGKGAWPIQPRWKALKRVRWGRRL